MESIRGIVSTEYFIRFFGILLTTVSVQLGKEVPTQPDVDFNYHTFYHDFNEYVLKQGNAALYEGKIPLDAIKSIRDEQIVMHLVEAPVEMSSEGKPMAYLACLTLTDNKRVVVKMLIKAGRFQIVFEKKPTRTSLGLADDAKEPKDIPGWEARVRDDPMDITPPSCSLVVWLMRPRNTQHSEHNRDLPARKKGDKELPPSMAYVRGNLSDKTLKKELAAINMLRRAPDHRVNITSKCDLLCGSDFSVKHFLDLFEGLSEEQMADVVQDMTPSQLTTFTKYLRALPNGVGLVHGPFGTGKTMMIARLAKAYKMLNRRHLVLAAQNAAANTDAFKLMENPDLMVVRLHSTNLETTAMTRHARGDKKYSDLQPANELPEPPEGTETEQPVSVVKSTGGETIVAGAGPALPEASFIIASAPKEDENAEDDEEAGLMIAEGMQCESFMFDAFQVAMAEVAKADVVTDRMKVIEAAIHTRILQLADIIPIIQGKIDWVEAARKGDRFRCDEAISKFRTYYEQAKGASTEPCRK